MLDRIMKFLGRESFEAQVKRLAKDAIREAIRLFESDDLHWVKGVLLANGGQHSSATFAAVKEATRGCALGGIGKAAWIVTGKPSPTDREAWLLKEYVEAAAMNLSNDVTYARVGRGVPSYNDDECTTLDDVIQNVLTPALDGDLDKLPVTNPYTGQYLDDAPRP